MCVAGRKGKVSFVKRICCDMPLTPDSGSKGVSVGIRKDKGLLSADELRRLAEDRLQERTAEQHSLRTDEVTHKLVHELEVHQI